MSKIVLVTGGFDPLHSGHIAYFEAARRLGDKLIVGLNSDDWLARKKGRYFMPFKERASIVNALSSVDGIISFDDSDDTACGAIYKTLATHGTIELVFANGGDRTNTTTPEYETYNNMSNVEFAFGIGGEDKRNSSSWILKEWQAPKTERSWGHYRELYSGDGFSVKELVIAPHSKLSMQRHQHRSETWNLVSGVAHLLFSTSSNDPFDGAGIRKLCKHNPIDIPKCVWHQGVNNSDEPAHIVEVWKGDSALLSEDDIERRDRDA